MPRLELVRIAIHVAAFWFVLVGADQSARCEFVISIQQDSANVVVTGSGTIDTTDLSYVGTQPATGILEPGEAVAVVGAGGSQLYNYFSGISGPHSFGSGNSFSPNSSTGSYGAGVYGFEGEIAVSYYAPSDAYSSTMTFDNTTISDLGLTTGTYTFTWGSGVHADSLVVQIGPASPATATPEPNSLAMAGTAMCFLAFCKRVRSRRGAPRPRSGQCQP